MQARAAFLELKENLRMGADLPPEVLARLRDKRETKALQDEDRTDESALFDEAEGSLDLMKARAYEIADLLDGEVVAIGLKNRQTASNKIKHKYNGAVREVCDLVRCLIVIDADDVPVARALVALHESVVSVKDLIAKPSKTGLMILNAKTRLENGHKGEAQIVTRRMHEAMQQTHGPYKEIIDLTNNFAAAALPAEVSKKIKDLRSKCDDLHATGAAMDRLHRFVDSVPA